MSPSSSWDDRTESAVPGSGMSDSDFYPADYRDLAIWLAGIVGKQHGVRYEAFRIAQSQSDADKAAAFDHLVLKTPMVQGCRLRKQIEDIGELDFDEAAVRSALGALAPPGDE